MFSWYYFSLFMVFCVAIVSTVSICKAIYNVISEIDHWKHSSFKRFMIALIVTISPWICSVALIAIVWVAKR